MLTRPYLHFWSGLTMYLSPSPCHPVRRNKISIQHHNLRHPTLFVHLKHLSCCAAPPRGILCCCTRSIPFKLQSRTLASASAAGSCELNNGDLEKLEAMPSWSTDEVFGWVDDVTVPDLIYQWVNLNFNTGLYNKTHQKQKYRIIYVDAMCSHWASSVLFGPWVFGKAGLWRFLIIGLKHAICSSVR